MILTMIINLAWFSNSFSRTAIDSLSVTLDQDLAAPESQFLNPLSEQAVIDSALKNSRKLQFLNTNVEIAEYRLKSSGLVDNPELRIRDISTRYYTQEFDEMSIGLRWQFPKPGQLGEEKQEADVRFWERKVDEIRYRQELIARVRRTYADVILYDQLVKLAQKRVELEDERINVIEKLTNLGRRSIVYFTKAQMWLAEAKNDYTRALQNQVLARRRLAKRTGIPEDTPLIYEELPEVTQEVEQLVDIAYANRPEIKLIDQRIELANKQNKLEHLKLLPWPNFVEMSYHREKQRYEDWGELRMGIYLPIFNWNIGNIKATALAVKKKEGESDAIRESIEEEVRTAFIAYKDLLLDFNNFQENSKNLINNAQKVITQANKYSALLQDEVYEMELTIIDTKKLLSEKRCNLVHALMDLYYTMGIEGYDNLLQY